MKVFLVNLYRVTFVSVQEVGMPADYVNKLARMFQDIKVSEDLNQSFKEMHKHNKLALPGQIWLSYDASELEVSAPAKMLPSLTPTRSIHVLSHYRPQKSSGKSKQIFSVHPWNNFKFGHLATTYTTQHKHSRYIICY